MEIAKLTDLILAGSDINSFLIVRQGFGGTG